MIELTLPTMTCGHCVRAVTTAVQAVDPQARVQVDLESHCVRIDTEVPADRIRAALAEEGYEAA